jgi:integrase
MLAGPRPDRQLRQIVEVMLGTSRVSARSSLSVFKTSRSTARSRRCGSRDERQSQRRTPSIDGPPSRVALPSFAREAVRSRMLRTGSSDPDTPLFHPSRNTAHANKIRRLLRDVTDEAGIENVTPHRSRRTVVNDVWRSVCRLCRCRYLAVGW